MVSKNLFVNLKRRFDRLLKMSEKISQIEKLGPFKIKFTFVSLRAFRKNRFDSDVLRPAARKGDATGISFSYKPIVT